MLVAKDASRPNAVFSWKCSLRGDFLFDTAWCAFCSAIWYPGIEAADPWDGVRRVPSVRDDADAWVDASERHHCYELHIGLTASATNVWVGEPVFMALDAAERLATGGSIFSALANPSAVSRHGTAASPGLPLRSGWSR